MLVYDRRGNTTRRITIHLHGEQPYIFMDRNEMKKCRSCGISSKNTTYEGDTNPFNVEHCMPCARILQMCKIFEEVANRPNIMGQIRKVKINVQISK